MRKFTLATLLLSLIWTVPVAAVEIASAQVPPTVTVDGDTLVLNGAGVRRKFFFKIYVGALYLKAPRHTTAAVLRADNPKSVRLHVVYHKVSASQLADAWNEGFSDNSTAAELAALKARIAKFDAMFPAVRAGDVIRLDLRTDASTEVWINSDKRGAIPGADFQTALLKIWLGDEPADSGLKRGMLAAP